MTAAPIDGLVMAYYATFDVTEAVMISRLLKKCIVSSYFLPQSQSNCNNRTFCTILMHRFKTYSKNCICRGAKCFSLRAFLR